MLNALIWWAILVPIQIFNVQTAFKVHYNTPITRKNKTRSTLLCLVYTLVCAYRAVLPRQDVSKICLFDTYLSSVFLGRTMAPIAEICFIKQIHLFYTTNWGLKNMYDIVGPIYIAEICSWMGCITTNELWNTSEEFIWMTTFIYIQFCNLKILTFQKYKNFKIIMTVISINTLYIAGMIYIDIPNYIINWMTKKHIYLSIPDGLYKTTYCNKV